MYDITITIDITENLHLYSLALSLSCVKQNKYIKMENGNTKVD